MGEDHAGIDTVVAWLVCDYTPGRECKGGGKVHDRRQDLTFIVSEMRNGIGHIRSRRRLSGPYFNNARPSFLPCKLDSPLFARVPSHRFFPGGSQDRQTSIPLLRIIKVIPSFTGYTVIGRELPCGREA